MKIDPSPDGRWTVSLSEDGWCLDDHFATREEAIAYAQKYPTDYLWVGKAVEAKVDRLIKFVDVEMFLERIEENLFEDWGNEDCLIEWDKDSLAHLHQVIVQALEEKNMVGSWYRIDEIERVPSV